MEQQYRIRTWRHDVSRTTYSTPTFKGETLGECDKKALDHFDAISEIRENEWDGMDILRIDAPAVAEKTTLLKDNGKQSGNMDWQL